MKYCFFGFFSLACMLTSGCASVGSGGTEQILFVDSEPKGAKIFYKDEWVGVTPDHVRVDSAMSPEIQVSSPADDLRVPVDLKTSYRWRRSFFSNLIFFGYAPVGWIIDLMSGGAWEINQPRKLEFAGTSAADQLAEKELNIAIAPPGYDSLGIASRLGVALQKKFEAENKYRVIDYDQSEKLFLYYGDGESLPADIYDRKELFHQLDNDTYLVSEVELADGSFIVDAKIKSAYTDKTLQKRTLTLPSNQVLNESQQLIAKEMGDYFYMLPNTVFINLGSRSQGITINNEEFVGDLVREDTVFGQMSQVVERVSISRLEPIQAFTFARFDWSFIPDINISRDRVKFKEYQALESAVFERTLVSLGYGPRLAYLASWGMIYFDLIPQMAWTSIESSGGARDTGVSENTLLMSSEIGYLYYYDKNWVAKIFSRSLFENAEMWEEVVRGATGGEERVSSNSAVYFGLSFGYRFDL